MSSEKEEFYIVTAFPNLTGGAASTLRNLQKSVGGPEVAEIFPFELPNFKVGTLEKLMSASDNLSRTDASLEGLVRKIERSFQEVVLGEELLAEGESAHTYLTKKFKWDNTKFQASVRPIEDLIRSLQQINIKLEEELKQSTQSYQEIKHELSALSRKRGGNLFANTPEYCTKVDPSIFVDTEFLTHVLVVLSRNMEKAFLAEYEMLASDAVGYGPPENRQAVLGSPVVPQSGLKIAEDQDGNLLYCILCLKSFKDVYVAALAKQRYAVRERFSTVANTTTSSESEYASPEAKFDALEVEFHDVKLQLKRWIKIHYTEAFSSWMHVKMIRVFVEAVLLYGLPVDFTTTILFVKQRKQEKKLRDKLEKFFLSVVGENDLGLAGELSSTSSQKKEAFYPYVSFAFKATGGGSGHD